MKKKASVLKQKRFRDGLAHKLDRLILDVAYIKKYAEISRNLMLLDLGLGRSTTDKALKNFLFEEEKKRCVQ